MSKIKREDVVVRISMASLKAIQEIIPTKRNESIADYFDRVAEDLAELDRVGGHLAYD